MGEIPLPTNPYEHMALDLMCLILCHNLFAIECKPTEEDGMCEMSVNWSSGALEQISALIGEWLETVYLEDDDEQD